MSLAARNDLDRAITRALESGHYEQLRMLKGHSVSHAEFLGAARSNRLLSLRPSPLLGPLVERWLQEGDLRESSRERYAQSWRMLFAVLHSQATLDALGGPWWAGFAAVRQVAGSTLNRDRAAVLAFLSWAKRAGHETPTVNIPRRKEEPVRSEILTAEQIGAVERVCRPDRWPFFWCLLETGARQGEVLNLGSQDIISGSGPVVIFRSQPGSKARGKERYVPISAALAACMRTLAVVNGGRVFPRGRTTVREWWAEICESAGIRRVTLHGIRATYITLALDSGVPATDVQKLVGHSNLAMTMRYYRNPAQSVEAADRIRNVMGLGSKDISEVGRPSIRPSTHLPAQVLQAG